MLVLLSDGSLYQNPRNRKVLEIADQQHLRSRIFSISHDMKLGHDTCFVKTLRHCESYQNVCSHHMPSKCIHSLLRIFYFSRFQLPCLRHLFFFCSSALFYWPVVFLLFSEEHLVIWLSSPFSLAFVRLFAPLIRFKGHCLVYDFQDILSDDTSTASCPFGYRRLLASHESWANNHANYVVSASLPMRQYLVAHSTLPASRHFAIYNSFGGESCFYAPKDRLNRAASLRVVWFSQTIGPDRGLDVFFAACRQISFPVRIDIYGSLPPAHSNWLESSLSACPFLSCALKGVVSHDELIASLQGYDCGLSLDPSLYISRDLTVTNKTILYLQAGLFTICSLTSGHREMLNDFGDVMHIVSSASEIVSCLRALFLSSLADRECKLKNAERFACSKYGWAEQKNTYKHILGEASAF